MSTLMNQTLPTIIGMGVVSHATDTLFGRRRPKANPNNWRPTKKYKGHVVHKGSRGGKYIIKNGRKVYI